MNKLRQSDALAALRLTRAGKLAEATSLVQRTLGGAALDPHAITAPGCDPLAASGRASSLYVLECAPLGRLGQRKAEPVPRRISDKTARASHPCRNESRGQFLDRCFSSAEGARAYRLYIPVGYCGEPCPLIVMLHGCTQSAQDFAAGTRMNVLADESSFLVAYPEQPSSANPSKCWNWFERRHQLRDGGEPSLVAGITREVMTDYAIDSDRVYVAGMSAGAAATAVLGAAYPDLYAAIGVHSGLVNGIAHDMASAFEAMRSGNGGAAGSPVGGGAAATRRPIPAIVFHGDRDVTVHPRNGERFAADMAPVNCDKRIVAGRVPGGRAYTQTTYANGNGQAVFELWNINGSGHAWSGGSALGSYTDPQGPDASREFVRFFLSHRLCE